MLTSDFFNKPVEENCKYGRYYCTTDKKYKCRQGPKQTRASESVEQGLAEGSIDDIEDTKQLKSAIALAKSQKAIRQAKYGKDQKFYADGTPVTPEEIARRAAERKAKKQGVAEEANPIDTVEMDVPLLIRALEYAREDAKDDMDLHKVVERMIAAAQNGEPLNMDDYNMLFGDQQENPKEVDEAKRKKKPKSSLMSKPAKRKYGGYFYPGYGYYGDGGDSGGGDGGGGGESRHNESRLYYKVAGTLNESLRKDFKMRKDRKGWFLPETASVKQKLDAERAFGEPIAEMNLLRPIKMKGPKNPVAVNQNGNKYKNPAKLIKFGK